MVYRLSLLLAALSLCATPSIAQPIVDYDIVAVKAPRYGDETPTTWQEVDYAAAIEPGQDLVLIHPDGSEDTLVPCAASGCSVVDPVLSLDGRSVYYAMYPDMRFEAINGQRGLPYGGADIYRMDIATRAVTRLTHQEFTPNTGPVRWASDPLNAAKEQGVYRLGYGVLNLGPCPVPGPNPGEEWIVFTSSRNAYIPARGLTNPNLQLFVMDANGENVRFIGHMNLASAMHPTLLQDGRVMFSSSEGQGNRDGRVWALWSVFPDGRNFEPLMSAFADAAAFHFQTQLTNGDIAVTEYYNLNNNGFGTILAFSSERAANGMPSFGAADPNHESNPPVRRGYWHFSPGHPAHKQPRYKRYPFSPLGLRNLTAFTHGEDEASSRLPSGEFGGKATHPSAAPNNDLLLIYTPGPANDLPRPATTPRVWGGIYLLKSAAPVEDPSSLLLVKRDESFNYQQPRAALPWKTIYGGDPAKIPYLPDGGTPYGYVGTSSFYNRNTAPGSGVDSYDGLDPFNTAENGASSNWVTQGADSGLYSNGDIHAVRLLAMEPSSHLSYGPDGYEHTRSFSSFAGERLRILGEIPLRKIGPDGQQPKDPDGNNDTSFLARIPADVSFTFQTLDENGLVLNMSQTWHQVRPGERRFDCGGCHAHSNKATSFADTIAGRSDYVPWDLIDELPILTKNQDGQATTITLVGEERLRRMDVEYLRDIKPIFERSCAGCHTSKGGRTPAAKLDLDDETLVGGLEKTYLCLTDDSDAECGYEPVISSKTWRQTNASRWVRKFQSRRSLLVWKVFGRRLDGWTNEDHPTESLPGDASTLPEGANPNEADLDYSGEIMPPPGSAPALTEDEKMTIARWIDLGAPSDSSRDATVSGWFVDEVKPVLNVSLPRSEVMRSLSRLELAAYDYYSGLDPASLSVTADFEVNGQPPGTELAGAMTAADGTWSLALSRQMTSLASGRVIAKVSDKAGNISINEVSFSINENGAPEPTPAPTPGNPGASNLPVITSRSKVRGTPGERFRYKIRATNVGKDFAPVTYRAQSLPKKWKVSKRGVVSGKMPKKRVDFVVTAQNKFGTSAPSTIEVIRRKAGKRRR